MKQGLFMSTIKRERKRKKIEGRMKQEPEKCNRRFVDGDVELRWFGG